MKKIVLILFLTLLLTSCYTSPTSIKYFQPVLDIDMKDTLNFSIPLGNDSVWDNDDVDSLYEDLVILENEGLNAYITEIAWEIYDYSDRRREDYTKIFLNPVKVDGKSTDTLSLLFFLSGLSASRLDENDGSKDNVAYGTIRLNIKFYDDYGLTYTSKTFYKYVKAVVK
ncbi:MAG: hypothetical protein QME48_05195 [bacterium]|uniref:Lipoprotein n=1 Tax=candidate division WOR-3 bacterium TaxID=2052148 RepID=A0A348MLT7_UNCW3|nr:MAG: hypothetical protein XD76_0675 [candidate division TA06 bacterium 32_111]MDI6700610.1 hypothetical protein [bacterium]HAF08013.1 hypothetical protein [candidate division WOR-3 bacterium]